MDRLLFGLLSLAGVASSPLPTIALVRKCCPLGEAFLEEGPCVPAPDLPFTPFVFPDPFSLQPAPSFSVLVGLPSCDKYHLEPGENFRLLSNATLTGPSSPTPNYCVENFQALGTLLPVLCFPEQLPIPQTSKYSLYPVGMILSLPCLLATFSVYLILPELQNLNGRCILCYVTTLLLSYLTLSATHLFTNFMNFTICQLFGYAIQFFFLATFFWLNIMCFDIFWAFSDIKKLEGSQTERERKKFIIFSTYAWTMPMLILIATITIDLSPSIPENSWYKPNVGLTSCFFSNREGTWIYFYGPVAFLLLLNLIMFAVTAFRLYRYSKESSVLRTQDSRRHDKNDKERFHLYLKLFIVMGINWVAEIVSYIAEGFKSPQGFWYLTDITNTLQGVFIFIIFVWKKRVRRLVKAKLCPASIIPEANSKSKGQNSSRNSSSSNTQTTSLSQFPPK